MKLCKFSKRNTSSLQVTGNAVVRVMGNSDAVISLPYPKPRNLQNASGIENKMSLATATGQIHVEV